MLLKRESPARGGADMQGWAWALLLKGAITFAVVFAYYAFVYRGSHFLGRFIKNPKLYDFLFRERGHRDRRYGLPAIRPRRDGRSRAGARDPDKRLLK